MARKTPKPTDPITDLKTLPKAESTAAVTEPDSVSERSLRSNPERFQIRYKNPMVASYVARVILMNMMDYESAAQQLVYEARLAKEMPEYRYAQIGKFMEETPEIQDAVRAALESRKLDERSKNAFVDRMWEWLDSHDPKKFTTAARILGKGFITEKTEGGKLEDLPLADLKNGVLMMLGDVKAFKVGGEPAETDIDASDVAPEDAALEPDAGEGETE